MKDFTFYQFSDEQVSFLNDYSPKDDMFTSVEEMHTIIDVLKINEVNDPNTLRSMRNSVVKLYGELENNEIMYNEDGSYKGRTDKFWTYNTAMMSVTAVIDNEMYKLNRHYV